MMKRFIAIQLAVFFITASFLYVYATRIFGASAESQPLIFMTPEKAYAIWDAVDTFENLWVPVGLTDTLAMKQKRALVVNKLKALVLPYEDLANVVDQLFEAYKNHNSKEFDRYKEKIAEMLRPVWRESRLEEQKKKNQMSWFVRIKENITRAMNNLYTYLFPEKKEPKPVAPVTQSKSVPVK